MISIFRSPSRKMPARRIKSELTSAKILLDEVRQIDIAPAHFLHQIYPSAIAHLAVVGDIPMQLLEGAEVFQGQLAKRTGWTSPCSFVQRALQRPTAEAPSDFQQENTFDHGFSWRLFIVKCFPDVWRNPPSLGELRRDINVMHQAALYHRKVARPVLIRLVEKYDEGLWVVGEHYFSWSQLMPPVHGRWESAFANNRYEDDPAVALTGKEARRVIAFCEHILCEISAHREQLKEGSSKGTLSGRRGNALLAKIVDESWQQWRRYNGSDPVGNFKSFFRFVMGAMDAVSPNEFKGKGEPRKTVRRYLDLLIANDNGFGSLRWQDADTLPGANKSQLVRGRDRVYDPA